MKHTKVYLPKDIDYVFCFLKETIIEEKDCDNYEHNLEYDNNKNVFRRTHLRGSSARYKIHGISGNILNSCDYCLKNHDIEEYILPPEAEKLFNVPKGYNFFEKIINKLF